MVFHGQVLAGTRRHAIGPVALCRCQDPLRQLIAASDLCDPARLG